MAAIIVKVYRYSPEQVTGSTSSTSVLTRLAADLATDSITSANIKHITCAPLGGEIVYTVLTW